MFMTVTRCTTTSKESECRIISGTEFARKFSGDKSLFFAFRWRRHVHPIVKLVRWGKFIWYILGTTAQVTPWLRPWWWYSNWYCRMVLCLALYLIWKHINSESWIWIDIIMLKNCDNQFKLISSEIEPLNHIDQFKNKPLDLLVNSSNANHILYIAGYRPGQEFDSHEHDTYQSHDWVTFMYTLIRFIQINQHNYQQPW